MTLERRRAVTPRAMLIAGGVAALLAFMALYEGDLPEFLGDIPELLGRGLSTIGSDYTFGLLLIEEAGVPLPIPGDVLVMLVGHGLRGTGPDTWLVAFVLFLAVILVGSSILYWISRRLGGNLPNTRFGRLLGVTPVRMELAQRYFQRWGALTVILGRHVPGFRIALSVAAGVTGMSYPVFVLSVAVSSAAWLAVFLFLGYRFGGAVSRLLGLHRGNYLLLPVLVVVVVFAFIQVRRAQAGGERTKS